MSRGSRCESCGRDEVLLGNHLTVKMADSDSAHGGSNPSSPATRTQVTLASRLTAKTSDFDSEKVGSTPSSPTTLLLAATLDHKR